MSDAHLRYLFPALGRDYVVMSYTSDGSGVPFSATVWGMTPSQFAVVAVEDKPDVTITRTTPTYPSQSTHTADHFRLQRGESYLCKLIRGSKGAET